MLTGGFLDSAGIVQCEKGGGDAELTFINGLMFQIQTESHFSPHSRPEGGTPISQEEGPRLAQRINQLWPEPAEPELQTLRSKS